MYGALYSSGSTHKCTMWVIGVLLLRVASYNLLGHTPMNSYPDTVKMALV